MKTNPKKNSRPSRAASRPKPSKFNSHELAFQPWFLPRASRLAIDGLIPPDYRNKMRAYFDDYGCMKCGKFEKYDANGMCLPCHHLIRRRLKTSVRRRMMGRNDDRLDLIMGRRKELASKLLGRFSRSWRRMSLSQRFKPASPRNPVDEALGFLTPGSSRDRYPELRHGFAQEQEVLGKSIRDIRPRRPNR
jgi:hypothetical protein